MKTKTQMAFEMAVAAKGKRKEYATKAITLLSRMLSEELEGHPDIIKARDVLIGYRKALDEEL